MACTALVKLYFVKFQNFPLIIASLGDGVDMAEAIGAASVDLKHIQVTWFFNMLKIQLLVLIAFI